MSSAELEAIERAQHKVRDQRKRERFKAAGLCIKGKTHGPPLPGKTKCAACTAKQADRDHRRHIEKMCAKGAA